MIRNISILLLVSLSFGTVTDIDENGEVSYMQDSHQFSGSEIILEGRYSMKNHEYVFRTAINGNIERVRELLKELSSLDINKDQFINKRREL